MLKNWFVKHQQKHNVFGHIKYLENENAKSHDGSRIVVLRDNKKTLSEAKEKRAEFRKEMGLRGGGVKNESSSFILSIPTDVTQLDERQWKTLSNDVIRDLHGHINKKIIKHNEKFKNNKKQPQIKEITLEDFAKHCHVVLHVENSKNSHIHLLVSNIINNDYIKPMTQRGASYCIKNTFNSSMKKLVNEDHMDYVPGKTVFENSPVPFSKKKPIEERYKNHEFASRMKSLVNNAYESLNDWITSVFSDDTLKIKEFAEETAYNLNELGNGKKTDVDAVLNLAVTVEKANDLPDSLKISNKVKSYKPKAKRPPRRRKTPKTKI